MYMYISGRSIPEELSTVWLYNMVSFAAAYDVKVFDTADEESLVSYMLTSNVDGMLTLTWKMFVSSVPQEQPFLELTTDAGLVVVSIDTLFNIHVEVDR